MKITHPTYMTLVVATHSGGDDPIAPNIVVGFGMLQVNQLGRNDWSFDLRSAVAGAVDQEAAIITQLADVLPMPKFLIAEAIEARVFKPIEAAANRADPVVTAYVRHRIARLQTAVSVDVSLRAETHVAPPPLTKSLALPPKISIVVVDGKIADPERTRRDIEKHAINYWLQFVCGLRSRQADMAAIATLTWLVAKVRTRPLDRQST